MTTEERLAEFVRMQEPVYERVLRELRAGRKESHWIWYIFPQMAGLGFSPMSRRYGIPSLAEAQAYLAHRVLGARLRECAQIMVDAASADIESIMGYPDDLKFRSSMTLFNAAAPEEPVFREALEKFFAGERDEKTLALLRSD